ncbi:MAG: MDR family MFS transporter [Acidimicrobiia bacterium]
MTISAEGSRAATANDDIVDVLGRRVRYRNVVAAVFVSALFLDILDTTIVNVALPSLGREFRTDAVEWVVLGYTLSLAVWIPVSGWLGDRVGTKRTFLFALSVFIGASALCGAAQSIGQLVAFRALQGVGGGMLTPIGVAMLFRAFPPADRARAATLIMIPTLAAPALGPIIGGLLVTHVGWRWIFYVNVPLGLIALAFGWRYLREHREPAAGRLDLPGFVLSGAGLASIVFSLSEGPRAGWTSSSVLLSGLVGVISFSALVVVELRTRFPMLELRLLRNRMFRNANIVSLFSSGSFVGLIFLLPLYLQNLRGLSALESGLTTFPQAFGVLVSSQVAGRLYGAVGPRRLMFAGMLAAALSISSFTFIGLDTDLWLIRGLIFVRGLCMGFAFVPMQASSYATIAPADNGRASSIFSTQRQMAISLGIALVATVLASYTTVGGEVRDPQRALTGFRVSFFVTALLALAGAGAALLVRDRDAAPTMRPRIET